MYKPIPVYVPICTVPNLYVNMVSFAWYQIGGILSRVGLSLMT